MLQLACGAIVSLGAAVGGARRFLQVDSSTTSAAGPAGEAFLGGAVASVRRRLGWNFREKEAHGTLTQMLHRGHAESIAEFAALNEKRDWAEIVELQLAKDVEALHEANATSDPTHAKLAAVTKLASLKATLASARKVREELSSVARAAENSASQRESEVEAIAKSVRHTTEQFRELAARAKRPLNEGRLSQAWSFAKAKLEDLENAEAEAEAVAAAAVQAAEQQATIEAEADAEVAAAAVTKPAAQQVPRSAAAQAAEEDRAMLVQLIGAAAAVLVVAFTAYSVITPSRSIAAMPPQLAVWEECAAEEPGCVEVEVCERDEPGCVEIEVADEVVLP